MPRLVQIVVAAALMQPLDALSTCGSAKIGRRAAVAGLFGMPAAVCAVTNPLAADGFSGYKERNYGDATLPPPSSPTATKATCDGRLTPDGFGGKKCVEKVKTIPDRVLGGDDDAPPPPPVASAAPKKAVGETTRSSTSSSSAALTVDELISNSIAQKEQLLGRPLRDDEKADLAAKVKRLLGS